MKRRRRKNKNQQENQNIVVALRRCITPKCDNPTPSFYCDECWKRQQAVRRPA